MRSGTLAREVTLLAICESLSGRIHSLTLAATRMGIHSAQSVNSVVKGSEV